MQDLAKVEAIGGVAYLVVGNVILVKEGDACHESMLPDALLPLPPKTLAHLPRIVAACMLGFAWTRPLLEHAAAKINTHAAAKINTC